jgi:hypothetical protein
MSDEDFKVFIDDLVDFLNGLEASIVKLRTQIDKLCGSKWSWDPGKIKWEKTEGFKGSYERSEDVNSLDFKELLKDLAKHNGKLSRDGWFYWVFKNGATVGRKRRESKNE